MGPDVEAFLRKLFDETGYQGHLVKESGDVIIPLYFLEEFVQDMLRLLRPHVQRRWPRVLLFSLRVDVEYELCSIAFFDVFVKYGLATKEQLSEACQRYGKQA